MTRDIADFIQDMLDAISDIEGFVAGLDLDRFRADRKTVYAAIRAIEIMGEAAKHIPDTVRRLRPTGRKLFAFWRSDSVPVWGPRRLALTRDKRLKPKLRPRALPVGFHPSGFYPPDALRARDKRLKPKLRPRALPQGVAVGDPLARQGDVPRRLGERDLQFAVDVPSSS